jgi:predicted ATP-dependent serine protease
VALPELRLKEIARMGFKTVICPVIKNTPTSALEIVQFKSVREALT